nr:sulfatase/phosphatase domain-containing protein [Paraflavitalea speifideiaquila]
MREPFIVQWPGKVQPGTTSDHLSATIDIMPTLCELLGRKPPTDIDGISLLPALLGKKKNSNNMPTSIGNTRNMAVSRR